MNPHQRPHQAKARESIIRKKDGQAGLSRLPDHT
jgi:hypothetical protein